MKQEVVFKKTSLPPLERDKKRKNKVSNVIFNILIGILLVVLSLTIGYVSQIVYNNARFSSFFVNGMSMYPTINRNAYATRNGETIELTYTDGNFANASYTYRCQTGIYDRREGFLEEIERFSIVCTYYSDDYSNGVLKSGSSAKIKRIIGLPGEWLYWSYEDGKNILNISQDEGNSWITVSESFLEPQSWWTDKEQEWYSDLQKSSFEQNGISRSNPHKLGEDQYFVCGDNRRHSNDSRAKGAVTSEMIDGLVVLLNGEANYYYEDNGWVTRSGVFDYYLPWKYQYLNYE